MPEDSKDQSEFKVVDRRSFAADGTRRDVSSEDEREIPATLPSSSTKSRSAFEPGGSAHDLSGGSQRHDRPKLQPEFEADPDEGETNFGTLVSYLYTTAMFQLGLMQGPGGERIPPDLPNARRTADLLEVLQKKTRGNLTPAESKLLDDVLYDVRVTFVDVQEHLTSKKR